MSLSDHPVRPSIAVSDLARAEAFFGGTLGLEAVEEAAESRVYRCGGGTSLHVYESPAHAGAAPATLATWYARDLERVVGELAANGVRFQQYDEPIATDAKGIFRSDEVTVAWFADPDGNTFAIEQHP